MLYYMYNSYNVNIGARVQEVRKFNHEMNANYSHRQKTGSSARSGGGRGSYETNLTQGHQIFQTMLNQSHLLFFV